MLSRIRLVIKYGVCSGAAIGALSVGVKLHDNDYDPDSLAVVRICRAARTAIEIASTYRTMLYSKEWDRESEEYYEVRSRAHQISACKLLELCKANKGVYIKVGQHIGALEYLLPTEYVTTMRILHSDAPKNSVECLYKVIKEDLNKDPKELFDDFEPEPLGTASLAQVHKAKLKDGTEVAVKVQHYFVKKSINLDLKSMEVLIKIMSKVFPEFQMQWLVDETKKNIAKELDFMQEGKNAEKVADMFKHYKWLKVPKIFWDYSSSRVLVMEYVYGGQVNDIKYINNNKINKRELCQKLGDLYSHMIFVTGFVHSDPHPGNILVRKDSDSKEVSVYLLDHGLYAQLTDKFRYHYSKLWLSIISRDLVAIKDHSEALGIRRELGFLFACMVTGRTWDTIVKGIDKTKRSKSEKHQFQNEFPKFMHYVTQCLENVDRQALLVLKTNDLIRSIEFALGLQDYNYGFMVMTECCNKSIYQLEHKNANSTLTKQYLTFKYMWSRIKLYLYRVFVNLWYSDIAVN